MQIKRAMRYNPTPDKMDINKKTRDNKCWEGCKKRDPLYPVGGNVNWYSHYGKYYGGSSKN